MTGCAVGAWQFAGRPSRRKDLPIHTVRVAAGAGVIILATAAGTLLGTRGLPSRLSADASVINQAVGTNYRCPVSEYLAFGASRGCLMNLPSRNPADADVILLGNSHAQMYEPVWASILASRGQTGLLVPINGCLPTVQANVNRECIEIAAKNLAEIAALARARIVIVGLNWSHSADGLVDPSGRTADNVPSRALANALDVLII